MEKNTKKKRIYKYIYTYTCIYILNHFAIREKLAQHYKSTILQ